MKRDNPFKIAKMSMSCNNFIYNEIVKRHIEEYEPGICDVLKIMLETMSKKYVNHENIFCTISGQAVDLFSHSQNFTKQKTSREIQQAIKDMPELFDFENMEKYYEWLSGISKKYNILATEIAFPTNMEDVVTNYSENFIPPMTYLFNTKSSDKFLMSYDSNSNLIVIPLEILTKKEIDLIRYLYILDDVIQNRDIDNVDEKFFVRYSSQNKYFDIRIDSFIKYVIGLYSWDKYKEIGKRAGYDLYQEYQMKSDNCPSIECFKEMEFDGSKFLIPEKSRSDFSCERFETCKKFVREAFKLVGTCIQDCKLYNSKHKCNFVYPKKKNFFERKPLSFFNQNHPHSGWFVPAL